MITSERIYFQPAQLNNVGEKVLHFEIRTVKRMYRRRYLLLDTALEFILMDGKSFLFVFDDKKTRDEIHDLLYSSYEQFSEGCSYIYIYIYIYICLHTYK
jgi:factor associated with neutral sphingomyelinase activation